MFPTFALARRYYAPLLGCLEFVYSTVEFVYSTVEFVYSTQVIVLRGGPDPWACAFIGAVEGPHPYARLCRPATLAEHHEDSMTGSGIVTASSRVHDCRKAALQTDMTVSANYHIRKEKPEKAR
jgi:hypothetical protein